MNRRIIDAMKSEGIDTVDVTNTIFTLAGGKNPYSGTVGIRGPAISSLLNSGVRFNRGRIEYLLPKTTKVTIRLFTIKGGLIAIIADSRQEAGWHRLSLPPGAHAAGHYILGFKAGEVENDLVVPVILGFTY
jgi:hypothetical protein